MGKGYNALSPYYDNYFNQPWEYTADDYGDVDREYASYADELARAYWWWVRLASQSTGL